MTTPNQNKMKKIISVRTFQCMIVALLLPLTISCSADDEKLSVEHDHGVNAKGENSPKVYEYVEQMPEYKGGQEAMMQFLGKNIKYPNAAKEAEVEGIVVLQFVVQTDGTLKDIEVVKDLGYGTAEEAVRVLKMMDGQWKSGKQNGAPILVRYTLPVRYAMR